MKALIALSLLGVITLFAEIFRFKKYLFPIILAGLLCTIYFVISEWGYGNTYFQMMRMDSYAIAFSVIILSTSFLWFLMSRDEYIEKAHVTDHYGLILFSLVGALLMASYNNLSMLFLGIEILSIPVYVLAGSHKDDLESNESAMKYFLMGSFATGFLLFGIALIYGTTGSFDINTIANRIQENHTDLPGLFYGGLILVLAGLSFKVAVVPFHFWAPDVYKGAPTVVTAYMATIVKTAAFAAILRLFSLCFSSVSEHWQMIVWGLCALSLIVGNITAVYQKSVKRMLAYSSISHAGFMLMAILAMNQLSGKAIVYYTAAYSVASIAAFAVLNKIIITKGNDETDSFDGLAKNNPLMAFAMTLAMLSMAGIPPLAGFFAKYYIFTGVLSAGFIRLVIIALMGSLIGVYYYFRIIIAMYFKEAKEDNTIETSLIFKTVLIITSMLLLVLGLFPQLVIRWLYL